MIIINERVETSVPEELLERLRSIPPATIGHVLNFGFMDIGLRPIGRSRKGWKRHSPSAQAA